VSRSTPFPQSTRRTTPQRAQRKALCRLDSTFSEPYRYNFEGILHLTTGRWNYSLIFFG